MPGFWSTTAFGSAASVTGPFGPTTVRLPELNSVGSTVPANVSVTPVRTVPLLATTGLWAITCGPNTGATMSLTNLEPGSRLIGGSSRMAKSPRP